MDANAPPPVVRIFGFAQDSFDERVLEDLDELATLRQRWPVLWVNVDGLGDADTLNKVAALFDLHYLALEDAVNLGQRAKIDPYDDQIFLVARMPEPALDGSTEQLSLFLTGNVVVTLQEKEGDCFEPVRQRIRAGKGRLRRSGPDYLVYALLDAAVDGYFPALEALGQRLEQLEDEVYSRPTEATVQKIQQRKRELLALRQAIWPHRDLLSALLREESSSVKETTHVYLRDCLDHVIRIIDMTDAYRETVGDLMASYMSSISNRMNEVMKVLTIIATIFIPLSFIAGLYGMNFDRDASPWNMPELGWPWGYSFALGVMAAVAIGMLLYFRKKDWLP